LTKFAIDTDKGFDNVKPQTSAEVSQKLMKWEKFALPSELPNKTLWKIDTEEQGALRL
jgi:hypothetical protein